jgi:broad specificity phosphatase PhoE
VTNPTLKAGSDEEPAFAVPSALPDGVALWLIRHGETEWSKSGQHTGRTDLPLTSEGEEQAKALPGMLGDIRPAFVVSSPLERARATARLAGWTVDEIDPDLAEWDYGDYEGRTTGEIREGVPDWTIWTHGAPNGETIENISARADRVLQRAAKRLSEGPVVLLSHGHMSRAIGARWIGLPAIDGSRLTLATAAPSLLSTQYEVRVIERWNMLNPAASEGNAR